MLTAMDSLKSCGVSPGKGLYIAIPALLKMIRMGASIPNGTSAPSWTRSMDTMLDLRGMSLVPLDNM